VKAGIIFTGSGPILILTSYARFDSPGLAEKLSIKGIKKYIAYELPLEKVKEVYGTHYDAIINDVQQSDDLRVLDYDGHHVFYNFAFNELPQPIFHEPQSAGV
jgi:hypothetical protein